MYTHTHMADDDDDPFCNYIHTTDTAIRTHTEHRRLKKRARAGLLACVMSGIKKLRVRALRRMEPKHAYLCSVLMLDVTLTAAAAIRWMEEEDAALAPLKKKKKKKNLIPEYTYGMMVMAISSFYSDTTITIITRRPKLLLLAVCNAPYAKGVSQRDTKRGYVCA